MTPNPQCASLETTIIDALHMMHDGKFLHLPVVDKGKSYLVNCFHIHNFVHFCAEYYLFHRWKCCCLCGCFADKSRCNFSGKFIFEIYIKSNGNLLDMLLKGHVEGCDVVITSHACVCLDLCVGFQVTTGLRQRRATYLHSKSVFISFVS
jgi:CBS domain-containing protein